MATSSVDASAPESTPDKHVLDARGLSLGFDGRTLFDGLDLRACSGETVAIIGRSGCGKSTLLNVLAGLSRPDAGTVRLDGVDITARPGHCALMPQDDLLLPWRDLERNATLALEIAGVGLDEARDRVGELLPAFGLEGARRHHPHELSGGMRQRAALLRSCLYPCPVLLLDEPFGALDALTREDLRGWFGALVPALDLVAVVVTHDIDEALALATRVVVFRGEGRHEQIEPTVRSDIAELRRYLLGRL